MKFILEIDLGAEPSAKNLAGQLHRQAVFIGTSSEPLKPQVWGIEGFGTIETVGKWEIREGKTLADFAGSTKLFKRPMHANPHGFTAGGQHLHEIRTSTWGGTVNTCADFPRLTAEDLTATDWEEVKEPESFEDEARRVFGACGGKCGDPPCVAWNEKHRKRS